MTHPDPKFRHGGGDGPRDPTDDELFRKSPAMAIARDMMDGSFFDGKGQFEGEHEVYASSDREEVLPTETRPGSIARHLLNCRPPGKAPVYDVFDRTRPLIDIVHEASVRGAVGLDRIEDRRVFQQLLRRAKCFTLDAATSAMVADLSIAVANDIDGARQMALPPFPVTWFELDNEARLRRMEARGIALTPTAAGETDGDAVPRVGWLIQPDLAGYCLTYFTVIAEGVVMSPLSWLWTTGEERFPVLPPRDLDGMMERLSFGTHECNAVPGSYSMGFAPNQKQTRLYKAEQRLTEELAGELRHVFGLLVAVSAGHAGLTMSTSPKAKPEGPGPIQPNGKPLFPLEHHHLHLHLGKRQSVDHVVRQIITHHRKRQHDVRAHMRRLHSGRMVPVKSHQRGDRSLGVITKDYIVEK